MTSDSRSARDGSWPNPIRQFFWDFLPKERAPENSGIKLPEYDIPSWLSDELCQRDDVLELARLERQESTKRATDAEGKGHRLVQASLALVTLALALAGFQIAYIRDDSSGWAPYLVMAPTALAISCLVVAGIEGLELERVGIYWPPAVADLEEARDVRKQLILSELRGSFIADWTAGHKVNALLQTRAWFSRGVVLLVIAAGIALWMVANEAPPCEDDEHSKQVPAATAVEDCISSERVAAHQAGPMAGGGEH